MFEGKGFKERREKFGAGGIVDAPSSLDRVPVHIPDQGEEMPSGKKFKAGDKVGIYKLIEKEGDKWRVKCSCGKELTKSSHAYNLKRAKFCGKDCSLKEFY